MILGIYVPTLGRAKKLQALADNLKENTHSEYKLYWCVEPTDRESILAAKDTGAEVIINSQGSTYSNALQEVYEQTSEAIFLWGNDDFYFLKDWDVKPLKMMEDPKICVLGLHDGNPQTKYSTISLVRRSYIEEQSGVVDMPNRVLYPYNHNYVDDELTETAQKRGAWGFCPFPTIEHRHPSFKWLGDFPTDETNKKNDSGLAEDSETFHSRRPLWQ